jgi:hypothetical protein
MAESADLRSPAVLSLTRLKATFGMSAHDSLCVSLKRVLIEFPMSSAQSRHRFDSCSAAGICCFSAFGSTPLDEHHTKGDERDERTSGKCECGPRLHMPEQCSQANDDAQCAEETKGHDRCHCPLHLYRQIIGSTQQSGEGK